MWPWGPCSLRHSSSRKSTTLASDLLGASLASTAWGPAFTLKVAEPRRQSMPCAEVPWHSCGAHFCCRTWEYWQLIGYVKKSLLINICWHSRRMTIIDFCQGRKRRTGFLYLACRLCAPGGRHPAGGWRCSGTDSSSCPCPAAAFGCCLLWRTSHVFWGASGWCLQVVWSIMLFPLLDGDSIARISQWNSPTNDQLSWAAACASFWSSSNLSTSRLASISCSISSCTPSRSILWLVGTAWRCLWLGLGRQTVSESLSPRVHSPAVLCSIWHPKVRVSFFACVIFGCRTGMRPGRIGHFQSHPPAKSQTLDCTPEMSWSSGASSLSLQACAVLSHGLCLVRRMRASWGLWKTGRRF